MTNHVVSAPRSGLNWMRYCVEHFFGLPTPGKKLVVPNDDETRHAFVRTHDALFARHDVTEGRAYRKLDPDRMAGHRVLLILRDPLETFVRSSRKSFDHFALYSGNIRFFVASAAANRRVVYYEDIVADPAAMFEALSFLSLSPSGGQPAPTLAQVAEEWQAVSAASRRSYQRKQFWGGGAKTRKAPLDFEFHQRMLSEAEKSAVWASLSAGLSPDEQALIARYRRP